MMLSVLTDETQSSLRRSAARQSWWRALAEWRLTEITGVTPRRPNQSFNSRAQRVIGRRFWW
jgi:hypothetical protein